MKTTLPILAAILFCSPGMAKDKDVMSVDSAKLTVLKGGSAWVQIDATGKVRTGGWTHGRLSPMFINGAPKDGLYAFSFLAIPPTGTVTEQITSISVDPPHVWKGYPTALKGVKIVSASNCIIALMPNVDASSINPGSCKVSP